MSARSSASALEGRSRARTAPSRPGAATLACVAGALLCGACATAPPGRAAWLEGAPSAQRVDRRAAEPRVCRTIKPTGSHVEQQVCLSPEDDRRQRDAARRLLQAAASAPWRGR